ncbi:alpha/beta fold hydrolase [Streptomyces luteolus]|uniref:Alpha/beta hydrolase n=1 Tax=Streptomyces luteolus TaxID=3043615 RepID=A0ABT6T588_9ACTN|nr:alpha/beta hydrolase [Streptomyces sp. B-S-A12]MDI3422590.1 alpha/beta hydrolase [Streptomyces sp. B-S-A12]
MTRNSRKTTAPGPGATTPPAATGTTAATTVPSDEALARSLPGGFTSEYATVNGLRMHYVTGGHGDPLFLLPGWPQTWWAFHKIMPDLARHHRVVAVDIRGQGGTDMPEGGYDKKTMASDLLGLVHTLGYRQVNLTGHDIGAMVAYSFAANYPEATRKLALLDTPPADASDYDRPLLMRPNRGVALWWWAFNQLHELPEQLLAGRMRHLLDWLFAHSLADQDLVTEQDREIYAHAHNTPEAIRSGTAWYQAFHQDIEDLAKYPPLTMPLLGIAGTYTYDELQRKLPPLGTDVRVQQASGSVHFLPEEEPELISEALLEFFA